MSNVRPVEWMFQKLWDAPKDRLEWNAILEEAKKMESNNHIVDTNKMVTEWLANKLYEFNGHDNPWFDIPLHLLEQAKQMEKEQHQISFNK